MSVQLPSRSLTVEGSREAELNQAGHRVQRGVWKQDIPDAGGTLQWGT